METLEFSESFEACHLTVGRYRQLIELMNFKAFFSSETTGPIKAKLLGKYPWEGRIKVCINGKGHMTKMACMPIYCRKKNLKRIFFCGNMGLAHCDLKK